MDSTIFLPFCILIPALAVIGLLWAVSLKEHRRNMGYAFLVVLLCGLVWGAFTYKVLGLDEGLALAAQDGNRAEVERLLKMGASPDSYFEGDTALQLARQNGHTEIVKILERAGAHQ